MPEQGFVSIEDDIKAEAERQGVPLDLALGVAEQESGFNPTQINPTSGAVGTFQFLPSTAKARGFDPHDQRQNIVQGVKYLRELLDKHQGDPAAVLKEYGGVVNDQAYVPGVQAKMSKYATTTTPAEKPTTPPPAETAKAPETRDGFVAKFGKAFKEQAAATAAIPGDLVTGAAKYVGKQVSQMGDMVRKRIPALDVGPSVSFSTEPTNLAQKAGGLAAETAEFAGATGAVGKAVEALPLVGKTMQAAKVLAQAATNYGVTKAQGGSETGARVNAAIGGVSPVAANALEMLGPKIRQSAETKLARIFARGLENRGPMIDYGLKSGDIAPQVEEGARIVRQAARETLDLPIQASWGKWMTTMGKDIAAKTKTLQAALDSGLGDERLPKQIIADSLEELKNTAATHLEKIKGGTRPVDFNDPLVKEIGILKDQLDRYQGDHISVHNLVDLKRQWDDVVYSLNTVGKVGVSPEVLVSNAKKEAAKRGADTIRRMFEENVPDLAKLNEAVSHAMRLQDLTQKLYAAQSSMGPFGHAAAWALGGATGAQLAGGLHGMFLGGVTGRLMASALKSPLWQTLKPIAKDRLATALATGNVEAVKTIVTPLLSAGVAQGTAP